MPAVARLQVTSDFRRKDPLSLCTKNSCSLVRKSSPTCCEDCQGSNFGDGRYGCRTNQSVFGTFKQLLLPSFQVQFKAIVEEQCDSKNYVNLKVEAHQGPAPWPHLLSLQRRIHCLAVPVRTQGRRQGHVLIDTEACVKTAEQAPALIPVTKSFGECPGRPA